MTPTPPSGCGSAALSLEVASPSSLTEALEALAGATARTALLAGGTDLMVELETGRARPDRVVDLWRVDALRGIAIEHGALRLGALTTCSDLLADPRVAQHAEILTAAARDFGAVQIRNRATLGGNLGTASPAADLNPVLLALDAQVLLASRRGRRRLPAAAFLTGYRATARRPDELIEAVYLPPRPPGERRGFRKVGTRRAQSISKLVVALAVEIDAGTVRAVRAAAGSVAPRTQLLETLARELTGKPLTEPAVSAAVRAALDHDVAPVDDVRSTADYRRQALGRVLHGLLTDLSRSTAPPR